MSAVDEMETMSVRTASKLYDIREGTLRQMCIRGKIPAVKVGHKWYLKVETLERFFKGGEYGSSQNQTSRI